MSVMWHSFDVVLINLSRFFIFSSLAHYIYSSKLILTTIVGPNNFITYPYCYYYLLFLLLLALLLLSLLSLLLLIYLFYLVCLLFICSFIF